MKILHATIFEHREPVEIFFVGTEAGLNVVSRDRDAVDAKDLPERIFVIVRRAHNKVIGVVAPVGGHDVFERTKHGAIIAAVCVKN